MVRPYIVKFISPYANVGKTVIASQIVHILKSKGFVVGVIKHCSHKIDIEDKDSHKYLLNGADVVIASSEYIGIIYQRIWVDSLPNILRYISTPIIIVEGFKSSSMGDTIVVTENINELKDVDYEPNTIAYVVKNIDKAIEDLPVPLYTFSDIDKLANLVEIRALNHIYNQLPKINCNHCGYGDCQAFAKAYAKGLTYWCPVDSDVRLRINNNIIELNPYIKRMLRSLIVSFVHTLKDVPRDIKTIVLEINI